MLKIDTVEEAEALLKELGIEPEYGKAKLVQGVIKHPALVKGQDYIMVCWCDVDNGRVQLYPNIIQATRKTRSYDNFYFSSEGNVYADSVEQIKDVIKEVRENLNTIVVNYHNNKIDEDLSCLE